MRRISCVLAALLIAALVPSVSHAQNSLNFGGDVYSGGSTAKMITAAPRDTFTYGFSVSLRGNTAKDAHAMGFDVDVEGETGEDLYVTGGSVRIDAPVTEDLTVSGFNVSLTDKAAIGGNTRIAAGAIEVDGPMSGSLLATGGKITLNSSVAGDVKLTVGDIEFGPAAKISGTLTYSTPTEIEIPESVIAPAQVRFVQLDKSSWTSEIRRAVEDSVPTFWPTFAKTVFAFFIVLGFFIAVAAICFAFVPDRVGRLKELAQSRPGTSLMFGYLGLATLIGLIPASAITIIGLPVVPVVILLIIVLWLLGYLLGSYAIAMRVWEAFGKIADTISLKLLVLSLALVVLAILNFIPVIGWLINLAIVFIGLGAITISIVRRLISGDASLLAAEVPSESQPTGESK